MKAYWIAYSLEFAFVFWFEESIRNNKSGVRTRSELGLIVRIQDLLVTFQVRHDHRPFVAELENSGSVYEPNLVLKPMTTCCTWCL
jgi:hypothetical protein